MALHEQLRKEIDQAPQSNFGGKSLKKAGGGGALGEQLSETVRSLSRLRPFFLKKRKPGLELQISLPLIKACRLRNVFDLLQNKKAELQRVTSLTTAISLVLSASELQY